MNRYTILRIKHKLFMAKAAYALAMYRFRHWALQWKVDGEGDITLTVCQVLNLTKYKEHTTIKWGNMNYADAPKYVDTTPDIV